METGKKKYTYRHSLQSVHRDPHLPMQPRLFKKVSYKSTKFLIANSNFDSVVTLHMHTESAGVMSICVFRLFLGKRQLNSSLKCRLYFSRAHTSHGLAWHLCNLVLGVFSRYCEHLLFSLEKETEKKI